MALSLLLFQFSKRQNSTAIPADSAGVAVDVTLKNETSLNQPVFLLSGQRPNYTYCKFDSSYYFIDDIRSVRNNLYELVCSLDVLGTFRANIQNTNAFVEYATGGNSQIADTRMQVEYGVSGVEYASAGNVVPGGLTYAQGSKFITVLGQRAAATYWISQSALDDLFASIATWSESAIDRTSLETIMDTGLRQLIGSGSAADCVRDAYCLPVGPDTSVLGAAETIYLGMFRTGVQGNKITGSGLATETSSVAIPHHYTDWRKQSPYEVVQVFLPLYGTVTIPSDIAADSTSLSIECRLNFRSGDFTYYVSGNGRNGKEITVGGNCASPLAVGASNLNVPGSLGAIASGVVSAAFGNPGGVAMSTMNLLSPVPQSVGATGGISNTYPNAQCFVYYRNTSGEPGNMAATQGIPLFAQRQLSTLSGYVQTRGASVSGDIRGALRDQINSMLDAGFFME